VQTERTARLIAIRSCAYPTNLSSLEVPSRVSQAVDVVIYVVVGKYRGDTSKAPQPLQDRWTVPEADDARDTKPPGLAHLTERTFEVWNHKRLAEGRTPLNSNRDLRSPP
jgi:hypothetical protein